MYSQPKHLTHELIFFMQSTRGRDNFNGDATLYILSKLFYPFQSDCSATGIGPGMSSPHGPPPLILKSTTPMVHSGHSNSSSFVMSNPLYNPPSKDQAASPPHWAPYSNVLDIPEQIFAQQLTKMDCVSGFNFGRHEKSPKEKSPKEKSLTVEKSQKSS